MKLLSPLLRTLWIGVIFALGTGWISAEPAAKGPYDVVVYGGTPAGIMAAVAAAREKQKVILVEPSYLVGGMLSGGLTKTDIGKRDTVGGLPVEFFDRVYKFYRDTYGATSTQANETKKGLFFEPHIATRIFGEMLDSAGVEVIRKERLEDVETSGKSIAAITVKQYETGKETRIAGKYFIDGSYEGDLMAMANVPYRVGREARAEYNESLAGGTTGPEQYRGMGDQRVQSYNIRSTLTNRPDLALPIPKPAHYNPEPFRSFCKAVNSQHLKTFEDLFHDAPDWGPVNGKYDPNKADFPGINFSYSDGSYEERQRIYERVRDHWLSMWYMLQNDPSLPEEFRASAKKWGLPKDEFLESGHVSPQIYVRVARRMQGRYMITQDDLVDNRLKDDGICLATYNIDCHPIMTVWGGKTETDGISGLVDPWEIPYRALTPYSPPDNLLVVCAISATHVAYCSLRMEPVFMMIGQTAGIAAAMANQAHTGVQDISIDELHKKLTAAGIPFHAPFRPVVGIEVASPAPLTAGTPVQFKIVEKAVQSPLAKFAWNFDGTGTVQSTEKNPTFTFKTAKPHLVSLLVTDGDGKAARIAQKRVQVGDDTTPDVEVTAADAKLVGGWDRGSAVLENGPRRSMNDHNAGKGAKSAAFTADLPRAGTYEVVMIYPKDKNRASNVPIVVHNKNGDTNVTLNEREPGTDFSFVSLGRFPFDKGDANSVTIRNDNTDGVVAIDAVRWVWIGE